MSAYSYRGATGNQKAPKWTTWVFPPTPIIYKQPYFLLLIRVSFHCQYGDSSSHLLVPGHKVPKEQS